MRTLRTAFRWASLVGLMAVTATRLRFANEAKADKIMTKFSQKVIKKLGVTVNVHGVPANQDGTQTIFMANHLSSFDYLLFRSQFKCSPVASDFAKQFPIVNKIADRINTVYIPQPKRKLTPEEMDELREETRAKVGDALNAGNDVVLFPEGKMGPGTYLSKFKPTIFGLFNKEGQPQNTHIAVQPVSLNISSVQGQEIVKGEPNTLRDNYAVYERASLTKKGNVAFNAGYLGALKFFKVPVSMTRMIFNNMKKGGTVVDITYHEPMRPEHFENHAGLADATRQVIANEIGVGLDVPEKSELPYLHAQKGLSKPTKEQKPVVS